MHPPGRNVKIIFYDFCNKVHLLVSGNVTTLIWNIKILPDAGTENATFINTFAPRQ